MRLPDKEDKTEARRVAKEEKAKRQGAEQAAAAKLEEELDSDVSEDSQRMGDSQMSDSEDGEDDMDEDVLSEDDDDEGSDGGSDDDDMDEDEPSADDDSDAEKKKKKKKKNKDQEVKDVPPDPYLIRREATLLNLVLKSFKKRVIVFFNEKVQCHRMLLLFKIFKLKAVEVNGNLT